MRQLVEFLARSLVDCPDEVEVREVSRDRTVVVEVRVAGDDMGKIIGKQGRVVKAIRTVAKAAAVRQGKRVEVEIVQ